MLFDLVQMIVFGALCLWFGATLAVVVRGPLLFLFKLLPVKWQQALLRVRDFMFKVLPHRDDHE